MPLPIYVVDAFASRCFQGNPAAVVLLDEAWPEDALLQAIAAENNLSETAFEIDRDQPATGTVPLRWFTPTVEVDLCGHATLASAHVLVRYRDPSAACITFDTRSGRLPVTREGDRLVLDFPARPPIPVAIDVRLRGAFDLDILEALQARDTLVVVGSEREVRDFRPDFSRIAELETFAVILSAPGKSVDFVSRFFAPGQGIPEDPVTGSAHCTLAPYWASRLGRTRLDAFQVSPRGGELTCELRGDRVLIGGRVCEYSSGLIHV